MNVITNAPIIKKRNGRIYSDFVSGEETKSFQIWVNKNKGEKLVEDGIYGPKTKAAYSKFGKEYDTITLGSKPKENLSSPKNIESTNEGEKNGMTPIKMALFSGLGILVIITAIILIKKRKNGK